MQLNETNYYTKRYKPIKMSNLPEGALLPLDESLEAVHEISPSHARMLQMASQALLDCLEPYPQEEPIPVFMACPENLPKMKPRLHQGFIKHLQAQSQVNIDLKASKMLTSGRAGGFQSVELARHYLQETGRDFALVGGVDTYMYCLQQLAILDQEDRLLTEGVLDGFVPGEAAGFLLLASDDALKHRRLESRLKLYQPAIASEVGHRYSEEPYKGDGLANAFRDALQANPDGQVHTIYSSLNGESFGAKELGVAIMRNQQRIKSDVDIQHPAECFGDIGAAFGPVLLGLMSESLSGLGLAYCSSDGPFRSSICATK